MTLPELYAQLETLTPPVFYQEHPDENTAALYRLF